MFIRGILLVITLISHKQAIEVTEQYIPITVPYIKDLNNNATINRSNSSQRSQWNFEEYMKKFEPSTVLEQIEKEKKYNGLTLTDKEHLDLMFEGIDPTDEIMELDIENGNPKIVIEGDARRGGWKPGKWLNFWWRDRFSIRNRLYELMKQAIYQTRDKMIVMQLMREKYHNQSLFKMGYLMNKADDAAKIFSKFSFRAYRTCLLAQEKVVYRLPLFDLLAVNERQLDLLFNIEIFTDLILSNDRLAKEIFRRRTVKRTKHFDKKFHD